MLLPLVFDRKRKENPKSIELKLFEPTGDDVCPISQDHLRVSCVDFECCLDEASPQNKAARLPCGHSFNVTNLLYHWARNKTVACPVCRRGPKDGRLSMKNLPVRIRSCLAPRVRTQAMRDERERIIEDEAVARDLQSAWVQQQLLGNIACGITGRANHRSYLLQCTGSLVDGMCSFTASAPSNIVRDMGEVRMYGLIGRLTQFPQSQWTVIPEGAEEVDLSHPSSSCKYSIVFTEGEAILHFAVPLPFFSLIVSHHDFILEMRNIVHDLPAI